MTKKEFLDKYGDRELFTIEFCVDDFDIAEALPDNVIINDENTEQSLDYIAKEIENGIMWEWAEVVNMAVSNSDLIKKEEA